MRCSSWPWALRGLAYNEGLASLRAVLLPACLTIVGLGAACRSTEQDPALLTLGRETVRRSEFEQYLKRFEARAGEPLEPEARQGLLESFLEERLLALEARRRGLVAPGAGETAEVAAVRRLIETDVLPRARVVDAEVQAWCAQHAAEFHLPERRTLRQVLTTSLNEARDVRRRLERDPNSFEVLARTRSRGPEAAQGGLMGTFVRGELPPELDQVAFSLAAGQLSAVIESPHGFHVLRVEAVEPAREPSSAECAQKTRARLLAERSEQARRDFVRGLRALAQVNHEAADQPAALR